MSKIKVNNVLPLPDTTLKILTGGNTSGVGTDPEVKIVLTVGGKVAVGGRISPENDFEVVSSATDTTIIMVDNTSTGDPQIVWALGETKTFCLGIDNSDSDTLKLGTTSISNNTAIKVSTAGVLQLTQPSWTAVSAYSGGNTYDFAQYWTNYSADETQVSFMKDSQGFVHVRGQAKTSHNSAGTTIFTLPTGYRPVDGDNALFAGLAKDSSGSTITDSGSDTFTTGTTYVIAKLWVMADGRVLADAIGTGASWPDNEDYISLNGILFYAGF